MALQAGYKLIGGVAGGASASDTLALYGSIGAPVTVDYNGLGLTSFEDVLFGPNGYATLQVAKNDGGTLGVTISGFNQSSEKIDLTGIGADGYIFYQSSSLITVKGSGGSVTLKLDGTDGSAFTITPDGSGVDLSIACFARGTQIRTPSGEVPVETLAIGDRVVTASGEARPVRWIGRRAFDGRFLNGNTAVLPITIAAGALSDGIPARDLTLSPGHALCIDGVLVPAEYLLNGTTVTQAESVDSVEYFHVELDRHDIIFAEGAANESYVDCDNRLMFANAAEFARLYPDDERPRWAFCAPRLDWDAPELAAIRERLLERATGLGHPGLDIEPDLRLVVDGAVLHPQSLDRQVHRFEVPAGAREVWLISRTTVPAYVAAGSRDPRRLGVPVECIALRDADLSTEVWHGELALGEGFHKDEATHCWTDGRALVRDELLRPFTGALTLEVRLTASELRYPLLPSIDDPRLGKAAPGRRSRDADLHLIADGNVVRPLSIDARIHRFVIPGGAKEVTIASRSVVPRQAEDGSRPAPPRCAG